MAERIRRHAWMQLKKRHPNPAALLKPHESNELLALARMTILNNPGDPGMELVRRLVAQLRGVPAMEKDAQTQALILGWAIAKEQYPNARTWMWTNYVRHAHKAPMWGESQTALQLKETQVLDQLLKKHSNALPLYNRHDIAHELGDVAQALDIAFKGQLLQDDEPMYDRFRLYAPQNSHYVQLESQSEQQAGLTAQAYHWEARWVVNPRLHFLLGSKGQVQTPKDKLMGEITPEWSQLTNLEARWFRARSQTSLELSDTDNGAAHFWGVRIKHNYQWTGHSSLDGYLAYRTESTISPAMRVAGYENGAGIGANFTLSKREYMRVSLRYADYFSQSGESLGSGRFADIEAGHRLRLDYPDWRISAYARWQDYTPLQSSNNTDGIEPEPIIEPPPEPPVDSMNQSAEPPSDPIAPRNAIAPRNTERRRRDFFDPFIPRSSVTTGVCLGMGENLGGQNMQQNYSRAWRYFGNVCVNQDSIGGSSVNGTIGVAGSIVGNDHVRIQFQSGNSMLPGNAATQSLNIRYRYYF
jgi:polysaccharide biosynthesis protein PelB